MCPRDILVNYETHAFKILDANVVVQWTKNPKKKHHQKLSSLMPVLPFPQFPIHITPTNLPNSFVRLEMIYIWLSGSLLSKEVIFDKFLI